MRLPFTTYAVAVLYFSRLTDKHLAGVRIFIVSGVNPLTEDEAKARGQRLFEESWSADWGSKENWRFANSCVSYVIHDSTW